MDIIEHVKHGRWPRPTPTNGDRLREFRMKMATLAVVTPNTYFHQRLFGKGAVHAKR